MKGRLFSGGTPGKGDRAPVFLAAFLGGGGGIERVREERNRG